MQSVDDKQRCSFRSLSNLPNRKKKVAGRDFKIYNLIWFIPLSIASDETFIGIN